MNKQLRPRPSWFPHLLEGDCGLSGRYYWGKEKHVVMRCILDHHVMGLTIGLIGQVKKKQESKIAFYNFNLSLGEQCAIYWDRKTGVRGGKNVKGSVLDMSILYCL